jgi:hypothetical protein
VASWNYRTTDDSVYLPININNNLVLSSGRYECKEKNLSRDGYILSTVPCMDSHEFMLSSLHKND